MMEYYELSSYFKFAILNAKKNILNSGNFDLRSTNLEWFHKTLYYNFVSYMKEL